MQLHAFNIQGYNTQWRIHVRGGGGAQHEPTHPHTLMVKLSTRNRDTCMEKNCFL